MRTGRWGSWTALLVAVAMLAAPVQAPALEGGAAEETSAGEEEWSWGKFLDLTACAVGIAGISSGFGVALAAIACGKAANDWWTT